MASARAAVGRVVLNRSRESDWREIRGAKTGGGDFALEHEEDQGTEASDDEINIVVVHIRRLARSASLEFALRVGAVIIHHFYDGQVDAWRSRGPKSASFRKLARHPGLPLSAGALYRAVALYELCERLRAPSRWEHLCASHLRLVLKLPAHVQEQLLARANAERWSVKVLHEVVSEQKVSQRRGGRRPEPPIERGLISMRRCMAEYRRTLEKLGALSRKDVESSIRLLEETRVFLDEVARTLHASCSDELEEDTDAPSSSARPVRLVTRGIGSN